MEFGDELDASELLVLLHVVNIERPVDEQAFVGALGESDEPIRMVEVQGQIDLGSLAELLNKRFLPR